MPDPVLNSESNKQKFLPPRDSVVMGVGGEGELKTPASWLSALGRSSLAFWFFLQVYSNDSLVKFTREISIS